MNGSSNHYSAADIQRYHSGQMTAPERHALEKAALDDPFLADAIEGYTFTATPAQDLQSIAERLHKKPSGKRVLLWGSSSLLWRAAAIVIVVAGLSWLVLSGTLPNNKDIAIQTTPSAPSRDLPAVQAPSGNALSDSTSLVTTDQNTVTWGKPSSEQSRAGKTAAPSKMESEISNEVASAPVVQQGYERDLKKDVAQNETMNQRTAGVPLAKNNAALPSFRNTTDSNLLVQKEEGIKVNTSDTIRNLNVILKPTNDKLEEVVVAKTASRRQKTVTENRTIEESEPAEGWNHFNDYIAENLKEPEEVKDKALSGDVELSFDISKEGYATNIKVDRSLCNSCNEEAIRLVKEGPKWKRKKSPKGKIVIHF
ncbi:MAG TPA: energy transducer TonB [Flavisolibacter sp.]|jgi:hypothetical protein|nr:energy transducer TonB [Flavisolibacter sp.]